MFPFGTSPPKNAFVTKNQAIHLNGLSTPTPNKPESVFLLTMQKQGIFMESFSNECVRLGFFSKEGQ